MSRTGPAQHHDTQVSKQGYLPWFDKTALPNQLVFLVQDARGEGRRLCAMPMMQRSGGCLTCAMRMAAGLSCFSARSFFSLSIFSRSADRDSWVSSYSMRAMASSTA